MSYLIHVMTEASVIGLLVILLGTILTLGRNPEI